MRFKWLLISFLIASSAQAGRIKGADLPTPSGTTLGGVVSQSQTNSYWINGISTSGTIQIGQPRFTDILGSVSANQQSLTSNLITASNIDWSLGNSFYKALGANTVFTFSNSADGHTIVVGLTNTTQNWTVTWPNHVKWAGGSQPTQTTGNKMDVITFTQIGGTIIGNSVQNITP